MLSAKPNPPSPTALPTSTINSALPADLARDFTPKSAITRKPPPWPVAEGTTGFGIVGGRLADYDDHPGAVALEIVSEERGTPDAPGWRRASERCGGTALTRQWIVTAAHCLEGNWLRVDVFYGHADIRTARRSYGFEAHLHKGYREEGMVADLAFLKLEVPLPADFPLARLATHEDWEALREGDTVIARGWGTTVATETGPDKVADELRDITLAVTHRGFFGARVARADRAAENVCVGDSGSGLRDKDNPALIYGVLSYVTRSPDGSICRESGYEATFAGARVVGG